MVIVFEKQVVCVYGSMVIIVLIEKQVVYVYDK